MLSIVINVLFMQSGSHPAPMFKPAQPEREPARPAAKPGAPPLVQRAEQPAPAAPKLVPPRGPRMPGEIITDIQRELARRGFYDGPVDGLYGPRTDTAIRDFERAAGFKPSTQPNEALLQAITRSPLNAAKGRNITGSTLAASARSPRAVVPVQPASARVLAAQRALAEFGYGQIKPTGTIDPDTQHAIERFERQHSLPVTGQLSDGLIRELGTATGRALD